ITVNNAHLPNPLTRTARRAASTYRAGRGSESERLARAETHRDDATHLRPQLVFHVVEQIFGVTDELALRMQRQAVSKPFRCARVQRMRIELLVRRSSPRDLVRRKLIAP